MRIGIRPLGHPFKRWDTGQSPAELARSFAVWEPLAGRSVARQDATPRDEPPPVPAQAVLCSPVLGRAHASPPVFVGKMSALEAYEGNRETANMPFSRGFLGGGDRSRTGD